MAVAAKNIPAPDLVPVRRALLSVSDKTGLIDFAAALAKAGVELVSTGGTAKSIAAAGITVRDVSELTGFPEIMDGCVKTLHPSVHGALLGVRDDPEHAAAMRDHAIQPIDLVVVNLYPFEEVRASGAGYAAIVENIVISAASGLPLLKESERNPMDTTTFGTGELISDALGRGCRKLFIAIGGSATNDGGMGCMRALNAKFFDRNKKELFGCGRDLSDVAAIDLSCLDKNLLLSLYLLI